MNKQFAEYLKLRGNELATVRISAICGIISSNNSSEYKYTKFYFINCLILALMFSYVEVNLNFAKSVNNAV